jgi:hypothetical protein
MNLPTLGVAMDTHLMIGLEFCSARPPPLRRRAICCAR